MAIAFDEIKFRELILYIANECKSDPAFGMVKLNKLMFFSDFFAYAELGEPITGAEYIKLDHGPAPKLMLAIREDMQTQDEIAVSSEIRYGYRQDRIVARRVPKLSVFANEQRQVVDSVIAVFKDDNATQLSDLTHHFPGWLSAAPRGSDSV